MSKARYPFFPIVALSFFVSSCDFFLIENDGWKTRFGTPELVLENAQNEAYVYLYEDENQFIDKDNLIKEMIKGIAPFEEADTKPIPDGIRYFTYQASWVPATSGPNINELSIWKNGFVRIHHKASLGSHKYLYFSCGEDKSSILVDYVFSQAELS